MSSSKEASPHTDRLPVEHLQGIVERVNCHSDESGYTVLRFNLPGEHESVTVIGQFPAGVLRESEEFDQYVRQVMMTRIESLAVLQESIAGACGLAKTGRAPPGPITLTHERRG